MDTCVFCGKMGKFDPEHWIPQWLWKAVRRISSGPVRHQVGNRTWIKKEFDFAVKHVCGDCNGRWMSDIETRARDAVLSLVLGDGPPETEREQQNLATWCFLKALSVEIGRPGEHVPTYPPAIYPAFRIERRPPTTSCAIYLARRSEIPAKNPTDIWFGTQGGKFKGPDGTLFDHYKLKMLIGHFVMSVSGLIAPVKLQVEPDEWHVVLWPELPGDGILWPPTRQFIDVVNNELL
jgi:hypothetical protein